MRLFLDNLVPSTYSLKAPIPKYLQAEHAALLNSAPVLGATHPSKSHAPAKRRSSLRKHLLLKNDPEYKIVPFVDSPMISRRRVHATPTPHSAEEGHSRDDVTKSDDDVSDDEAINLDNSDSSDVSASEPPDGGYGWVVVLASFCMQAITGGVAYVQGLMYPHFVEAMRSDHVTVAWACTLQVSVWFTGGMLLSCF